MTVTGCLRAGEAADTFVLTTSGTDVATYSLVSRGGVTLADGGEPTLNLEAVLGRARFEAVVDRMFRIHPS